MLNYKKFIHSKGYSALFLVGIVLFFSAVGFFLGRSTTLGAKYFKVENNSMVSMRLSGYEFISPLLACDTESELSSPKMDTLSQKIQKYIKSETNAGRLSSASVYVRDYDNSYTLDVNPEEKYYPASLNKIPVMIAALKSEKTDPNFLSETHQYVDSDYNGSPEIKPAAYLKPDQTYSINDAINTMIKYSDNNALFFLYRYIDPDIISQTFRDLRVTLPGDEISPQDYMTVKEFSNFLRVLYNSTYINKDYSEKALKLLSQTEFKDGLVAGLPKNTKIAHKFGVYTEEADNQTTRELHDCGLVYKGRNPYLICVMTKSTSSLNDLETIVKHISAMTYSDLRQ